MGQCARFTGQPADISQPVTVPVTTIAAWNKWGQCRIPMVAIKVIPLQIETASRLDIIDKSVLLDRANDARRQPTASRRRQVTQHDKYSVVIREILRQAVHHGH